MLFHLKSIHEKVNIFNEVVIIIFSKIVPNIITEIDDRDPLQINDFIKNKTKKKYSSYTKIIMGGNFSNLQNLSQDLSELITKRK